MKRRILERLLRTGLFRRISFTLPLRAGRARVRVPIIKWVGLAYFDPHERWLDHVLRALLRLRPGLFIDVGMNLGQTLIKVKAIDPDQPVVGFEPNPACMLSLQELIRLNGYSDVRVIPSALADHDHLAELQIYEEDPADGRASMVKGFRDRSIWRTDRIVCFRFDTVERDVPIARIGVVKIDVEGAESYVLTGMAGRLGNDRPLVVIEILPVWDPKNVERLQRQQAVEALMEKLDYRIVRLRDDLGGDLRLEPVDSIGIHDRIHWSNYLLVPTEMVDAVATAIGGWAGGPVEVPGSATPASLSS